MSVKNEMTLFGLDARALGRFIQEGWAQAMRMPALRWLSPNQPIRLLCTDGSARICDGTSAQTLPDKTPTSLTAIELPAELVLERRLKVPPLSESEIEQTLQLEVSAISPFAPENRAWGWTWSEDRQEIRLALASQTHIQDFLNENDVRLRNIQPEIWFDAKAPIVLRGFGEHIRKRLEHQAHIQILLMLLGLAALTVALAASPVLQLRQKTFSAQAAVANVEKQAAPVLAQRQELSNLNEKITRINAQFQNKVDAPFILEQITRTLADDVVLNRIELGPAGLIRLNGEAPNATLLLEQLGQLPGVEEIKSLGATTRNTNTNKEVFQIEGHIKPVPPWPPIDILATPLPTPEKPAAPAPIQEPPANAPASNTPAAAPAAPAAPTPPPTAAPAPQTPPPPSAQGATP